MRDSVHTSYTIDAGEGVPPYRLGPTWVVSGVGGRPSHAAPLLPDVGTQSGCYHDWQWLTARDVLCRAHVWPSVVGGLGVGPDITHTVGGPRAGGVGPSFRVTRAPVSPLWPAHLVIPTHKCAGNIYIRIYIYYIKLNLKTLSSRI